MKTDKLQIREFIHSDLPEVLSLWENHSGWGRPEEVEFQRWIETPYGACLMVIAENEDNRIVGQIFFTPTEILVEGTKKSAVKVSAPIIHADYRSDHLPGADSLVGSLFIIGIRLMKDLGFDWSYNFPAYGWAKILRSVHRMGLNPWQVEVMPCFEIVGDEASNGDYDFLELDYFSEDLKMVWEKFKSENKNLSFVTRDLKWLGYKWGDELKVGIYKNNSLEGYCVIKQNSGLILDYILDDFKDSVEVFRGLNRFYKEWSIFHSETGTGVLKFMPNGLLKKHLNGLRVKPVDFNFVFGISSLNADRIGNPIESDKWYIFPND